MNNEVEREVRNSKNRFELDGNVGSVGSVYTNQNDKKTLRFDLGQNNNGYSQFVPIVIRGNLVDTYGNEIQKGDWISVKGRISTYSKDVERDGRTLKIKLLKYLALK